MKLTGLRTFLFSIISLAFLLAGLHLCLIYPTPGPLIFGTFATSLVFIVAAVAGNSAVKKLADGDGVKGALANLMTDKKPGDPAAP